MADRNERITDNVPENVYDGALDSAPSLVSCAMQNGEAPKASAVASAQASTQVNAQDSTHEIAQAGTSGSDAPGRPTSTTLTTKLMLLALILTALVATYNENLVNVALPQIMAEFSIGAVTAQWLVSGYMVITTCVAIISALLCERINVRKIFYIAVGFTFVGLVLNMVAPTFELIFVARLIQSVGTGLGIPVMTNACLLLAPEGKQGTYMAIGSSTITFGPALAPVISGVIVTNFGWRASICVPMALILIAFLVGAKTVRDIGETNKVPIDGLSIAIALVGLFSMSYGLSIVTSNTTVALIFLAVFAFMVFVFCRRQRRLETPLLSLEPAKNSRFSPSLVLMAIGMLTTFSLSVMLPLYYQQASGLSADIAGFMLLGPLIANAIASLTAGMIYDKIGPFPVLPCGFLLITGGLLATTFFMQSGASIPVFVASFVVYFGVGWGMSPSNIAGLSALEPRQVPVGSAMTQTFVMIAASAGPALYTGIMCTVADAQMAQGVAEMAANAAGFSMAMLVALIIGFIGLIIGAKYGWKMRKRKEANDAKDAQ